MNAKQNLIGQRFGFLMVIGPYKIINKCTIWVCKCDCGNTIDIRAGNLKSGNSTKCVKCQSNAYRVDELKRNNPVYNTYYNMLSRCKGTGSNCDSYISKEIKIFWDSFEAFEIWAKDLYFLGAVLHRIDNDKNYTPDNCEFLSKSDHAFIHGIERGRLNVKD